MKQQQPGFFLLLSAALSAREGWHDNDSNWEEEAAGPLL